MCKYLGRPNTNAPNRAMHRPPVHAGHGGQSRWPVHVRRAGKYRRGRQGHQLAARQCDGLKCGGRDGRWRVGEERVIGAPLVCDEETSICQATGSSCAMPRLVGDRRPHEDHNGYPCRSFQRAQRCVCVCTYLPHCGQSGLLDLQWKLIRAIRNFCRRHCFPGIYDLSLMSRRKPTGASELNQLRRTDHVRCVLQAGVERA